MTRLICLLSCVAALAVPAQARDVFLDNLADYVIEGAILDAPNCEGPAFSNAPLVGFERGLCLYHRPARSAEDLDRAIDLLDQAQVGGLPAVHQQLATLITGLGYCAEAARHLQSYRASGNVDLLARTNFCRARRMSQAELNAMRWDFAMFEYAPELTAPQRLETRLGEMSACYAGVLAPGFDAECGLITSVTETELDAFVDEATAGVVETYFSGVESPITAMFQRKTERAEGAIERAEAAIDGLAEDAGAVNTEYDAYLSAYEAERDAKMTPIYENYTQSILRATAILDEFNRWKEGLFTTPDNNNLKPEITERGVEITEELTRAAETEYAARAGRLVEDVRAIAQSEAENRGLIGQLCRVYYCELSSRRRTAGTIRVCRQPEMANNPLCLGQNGQIKSGVLAVDFDGGQSIDVADFCRGAGIDDVFLQVGMSPATAGSCLEGMQ